MSTASVAPRRKGRSCSMPVRGPLDPASRRPPGWGCRCRGGSATPWCATPGSEGSGRRSGRREAGCPWATTTSSWCDRVRRRRVPRRRYRSRGHSSVLPRGWCRVRRTATRKYLRTAPRSPGIDECARRSAAGAWGAGSRSRSRCPVGRGRRPVRRRRALWGDPRLSAVCQPVDRSHVPFPADVQRVCDRVAAEVRRDPRKPSWPAADRTVSSLESRRLGSSVTGQASGCGPISRRNDPQADGRRSRRSASETNIARRQRSESMRTAAWG